jgi:N-acetylglutamate synthase-like GNAT family acetyltransferase
MAVDPNYLRQGIGTTLCSYGAGIAEEDGIPVGVIASTLGKDFFTRLGCRTIQQRTVKDTRPGMEAEVDFWVQTWTPVGTSS